MTKSELIKSIKAKSGICLSIAYLESLSLDKLKKLYEKYSKGEEIMERSD